MNIDWSAVLEALDLEPADRTGKINCPDPEHDWDKTASCHLYDDGHYFCYGCGRRGSTIDFAMRVLGSGYKATVQYLARTLDVDAEEVPKAIRAAAAPDRAIEYVDLTYRFQLESVPIHGHPPLGVMSIRELGWIVDAEEFAERRWGIGVDALHAFGVNAAANALWIPHYHPDGRIVGVKVRNTSTGDKVSMKGSRFGAQLYRDRKAYQYPTAFVVEGEPDAWKAWYHFQVVERNVSVYGLPGGASTLRQEWANELVAKHSHITLCFDNDAAGESARQRFYEMLRSAPPAADHVSIVEDMRPVGGKDFTEAYNKGWRP